MVVNRVSNIVQLTTEAGGLPGGRRGAAVGTGVGYISGNEADKKQAKEEAVREKAELSKYKVTGGPKTAYRPPNKNPREENRRLGRGTKPNID